MISPFRAVLAFSLTGNLLAATWWLTRPESEAALAVHRHASSDTASRRAPRFLDAPPAQTARSPLSTMSPGSELKSALFGQGYPPEVADMILAVLVDQKYGVYDLEAQLNKKRTPELQEELKRRLQQAREELQTLSGVYEVLEAQRDRIYAARYGSLPLEAIEAIRKLENAHRNTTDRQFALGLQGLLTPAQIEDYMRYNSVLAKTIQLTLDSIDVEEATYLKLLDAAIDREKSAAPNATPGELSRRNAQSSFVEVYRRILGDESFLAIIAHFDATIASADAIYQVAGLGPVQRADLFLDVYRAKERYLFAHPANVSREEIAEAAHAAYASVVQKAAFTPDQIAAFDQRLGSYLKRGDFGSSGGRLASRGW